MRALRARQAPDGTPADAGVAVIFALAFILLISTFILLLLSQVLQEARATKFDRKHSQTVNSAIAGLNGALNQLRTAVSTSDPGTGVLGYLPCNLAARGQLTGTVDAAGTQKWVTDVYYTNVDPTSMTLSAVQAVAMTCPLTTVPKYAYLLASGTQGAVDGSSSTLGDRSLNATYSFSTTNKTSPGGQFKARNGRCWDVGPAPAAGTVITFQSCLAAGSPSQTFFYRGDLSIRWFGAPTSTDAPLCLDYRGIAATPVDTVVRLQPCLELEGLSGRAFNTNTNTFFSPGQLYQEFASNASWNIVSSSGQDGSKCLGSLSDINLANLAGLGDRVSIIGGDCGYPSAVAVASALTVARGVGAGAAGGVYNGLPGPVNQLANLATATQCLDVNSGVYPSRGLIMFPCHNRPNQTVIEGNQQYVYAGTTTTPGILSSTSSKYKEGNTTVCLQRNSATQVVLAACNSGAASQQWLLPGQVQGDYARSYTIRDPLADRCLSNAVALAACNGKDDQKWNAPPGGLDSSLANVGEQ